MLNKLNFLKYRIKKVKLNSLNVLMVKKNIFTGKNNKKYE